MNYQQALDYLSKFINFEYKMPATYQPENVDPQRILKLLTFIGSPHQEWMSIHIAGTKGKGSVAVMCAFCLHAANLQVGLYTSPHLIDIRERIRILTPTDQNGQISQTDFSNLVQYIMPFSEQIVGITYYEVLTAIAFLYFAQQKVDIAVIEVGLGGRLDATNIITPLVSVITNISFDHTNLLGNTLTEIAGEKAGIIKSHVPVISAPQHIEAEETIALHSRRKQAPLRVAGKDFSFSVLSDIPSQIVWRDLTQDSTIFANLETTIALQGKHQQENAAVSIAALHTISSRFPTLTPSAIQIGLQRVIWEGRFQWLQKVTTIHAGIVIDGAHNVASVQRLLETINSHKYDCTKIWLLFGTTKGKDITGMLNFLLPSTAYTIATQSKHPRAVPPLEIQKLAKQLGYNISIADNVQAGLQQLLTYAQPTDIVCVTGSLYLVGDLLNQWEKLKSHIYIGD